MKDLGYGAGYQYAHDAPDARVDQDDLPEALRGRQYYRPTDRGLETELGRRLAEWRRWRAERRRGGGKPGGASTGRNRWPRARPLSLAPSPLRHCGSLLGVGVG